MVVDWFSISGDKTGIESRPIEYKPSEDARATSACHVTPFLDTLYRMKKRSDCGKLFWIYYHVLLSDGRRYIDGPDGIDRESSINFLERFSRKKYERWHSS